MLNQRCSRDLASRLSGKSSRLTAPLIFSPSLTCVGNMCSSECRSRLWEAEFNAAVDDLEPFAEALKRRRSKRTACECPEQMGSNM